MSLLKMPPTRTEVLRAQLAVKLGEELGEEPGARTREVAAWPLDQVSPESGWPTLNC